MIQDLSQPICVQQRGQRQYSILGNVAERTDFLEGSASLLNQVGVDAGGGSIRYYITGVAAADFSHIRKANLGRFTIDRLMAILTALGQQVGVTVKVHPRRDTAPAAEARL